MFCDCFLFLNINLKLFHFLKLCLRLYYTCEFIYGALLTKNKNLKALSLCILLIACHFCILLLVGLDENFVPGLLWSFLLHWFTMGRSFEFWAENVFSGEQGWSHNVYVVGPSFLGHMACYFDSFREAGSSSSAHLPWLLNHQSLGCSILCFHFWWDWQKHTQYPEFHWSTFSGEYIHCIQSSSIM